MRLQLDEKKYMKELYDESDDVRLQTASKDYLLSKLSIQTTPTEWARDISDIAKEEFGRVLNHTDAEWKSVTTLGDGNGWRFPRMWFMDQIELLSSLVPYRIWVGHVKDKYIKQDGGADMISGHEINLTGKLKNMLTVRVSTLAKLVADEDKRYLSFEVDNDNLIGGSRVPHLTGKLLISEKTKTGYKTHWDKIYPTIK